MSLLVASATATACGHFGVEIGFSADDPDASANVDGGSGDDASISGDGASDASTDARDGGPLVCQGPGCPVIYVAGEPVGNDANPGTADKPVATIQKGIDLAKAAGFSAVHVAAKVNSGKYPEPFTVIEGVSLIGAFDCTAQPCSWKRDVDDQAFATVIAGIDYRGIVIGDEITRATRIDGFWIYGKGQTPLLGPGAVALTIEGAPTVRNCRVEASSVTGGTAGVKRSIAIAILGPATKDPNGPLLEKNFVRGQQGIDESVGIWIDARGISAANATVSATISGENNIRSGAALASIGIFARRTSPATLIEGNVISSGAATGPEIGSWAIYSDRGAMKVMRNRLNPEATATGTSGPSCTQDAFCGGFRSDNSFAEVKSNIIRGARAQNAAGVLLHGGEGPVGELIVNGNTIDPVGNTVVDGTVSAAIALNTIRAADTTVGRVRNNILLGGTNAKRYGVYEQKLTPKGVHLEVVSNNAFWNPTRADATGDFAYHTWNGTIEADFTFAQIAQVTTPAVGASVGADPKLDQTFHLTSASTAVFDKGTPAEAAGHDFDNEARSKGQGIDLGADERQ